MSTTLGWLNLAYYRTADPERQAEILELINEIMASGHCPACGEPIEDGGACWNVYCPEGRDNIDAETADSEYHSAVDRAIEEAYILGHDL